MNVQPGVLVREYQDSGSNKQLDAAKDEHRPSMVRSGGDYTASRTTLNIKGKDGKVIVVDGGAKRMSLKEYRKRSGIRSYEIGKEIEEDKRKKSAAKTPVQIEVQPLEGGSSIKDPINISNSLEAELDKSFENSVHFKTSTNFSVGKTHRESVEVGKITLNPGLVA